MSCDVALKTGGRLEGAMTVSLLQYGQNARGSDEIESLVDFESVLMDRDVSRLVEIVG
jgi:hypothetical protein